MISDIPALIAYSVVFALVHSILADPRAKARAENTYGKAFMRWYRLIYTFLSTAMTLPFLYILSQPPERILYTIPEPRVLASNHEQLTASILMMAALNRTEISSFLGFDQLRGVEDRTCLIATGFYEYTRNPLFLFAIIFLWMSPIMTRDLLFFNILSTVYFILGALHEEKTLKTEFGVDYVNYRNTVPMFIPAVSKAWK
jgi:protein-S-isoprenylcysteine O-methyltransferase Ste14